MIRKINLTLLLDACVGLLTSFWSYFVVVNQQPISSHYATVQMIAYKVPSFGILVTMIIIDLVFANLAGRDIFDNIYVDFLLTILTLLSAINYISFKFYNTFIVAVLFMGISMTILTRLILSLTAFNEWYYASIGGSLFSILFVFAIHANKFEILAGIAISVLTSYLIRNFRNRFSNNIERILTQFLRQYRYVR